MVKGRVDPETYRAWDRWRIAQGITWAAMFEAIGRETAAGRPLSKRIVEEARRVDQERNSKR